MNDTEISTVTYEHGKYVNAGTLVFVGEGAWEAAQKHAINTLFEIAKDRTDEEMMAELQAARDDDDTVALWQMAGEWFDLYVMFGPDEVIEIGTGTG